ncbi:hypothetical protein [Mucilaginibacter pocheonensis]|uniref:Uncharacterized protein n=1 Tax=Mucilaginibacter pocheonensis TaxID=398050 RepID=A0ABU1T840_9SPHI|nr:hypothetical protein [Mucilaginibacter pocheonensis]MDR6941562.1 hypothetical protein [Mucilaginibacter pocheonensis]
MTQQDFIDLYEKYMSGKCTSDEIKLLEAYRDNFQLRDLPWSAGMGNKQEVRQEILNKLNSGIIPSKKKSF